MHNIECVSVNVLHCRLPAYYQKRKFQLHDMFNYKKSLRNLMNVLLGVVFFGGAIIRNLTNHVIPHQHIESSCILIICNNDNKSCYFCSYCLASWINTSHFCLNRLQNFNKKHMTHIFTKLLLRNRGDQTKWNRRLLK